MKKAISVLLSLVICLTLVACTDKANPPPTNEMENPADSEQSKINLDWENFLKEMEQQGISYDNIHSLENSGLTREEIMEMSAVDIKNFLSKRIIDIEKDKIENVMQIFADWEGARQDSQFVYSDYMGTKRLNLVDDFVQSVKANDGAGFTGMLIGGTVPVVYKAQYIPDGEISLTVYTPKDEKEPDIQKLNVTDIYETETFYQFSDNKSFYFSIPKVALSGDVEAIEGYINDSDIKDSIVTANQAKEAIREINAILYSYLEYAKKNDLGKPLNGYGMVIPRDFKPKLSIDNDITVTVDGAAKINGKYYYKVSFYNNGEFAGESYYIDKGDRDSIFNISMVDGSLIPIAYKKIEHFHLQR